MLMSQVHGCTGATLGTSSLDKQKRSASPLKGEIKSLKQAIKHKGV